MDTPHVIQTRTKHLSWLLETHPVIQAPNHGDAPPSSWAWVEPPMSLSELDDELAIEAERFQRYGGNEPRDPPPKSSINERQNRRNSTNTNRRFSTITRAATIRSVLLDPEEINWDGPDDPANPQNWTDRRKWIITLIIVIMTVNVYVVSNTLLVET
jgi:hypothetical protein